MDNIDNKNPVNFDGKIPLNTLLISIGKLKPTIDMITYRNNCALDSKGKTAFKSFYL